MTAGAGDGGRPAVPPDAAFAVGRFEPGGPRGYRSRLGGPLRATRAEAEADYRAGGGRRVRVHLTVEVPADDGREAFAIAQAIMDAFDVGSDHESVARLRPAIALAEDV